MSTNSINQNNKIQSKPKPRVILVITGAILIICAFGILAQLVERLFDTYPFEGIFRLNDPFVNMLILAGIGLCFVIAALVGGSKSHFSAKTAKSRFQKTENADNLKDAEIVQPAQPKPESSKPKKPATVKKAAAKKPATK